MDLRSLWTELEKFVWLCFFPLSFLRAERERERERERGGGEALILGEMNFSSLILQIKDGKGVRKWLC